MSFNPFKRKPTLPTNENLLKAITVLASAGTAEAKRAFYKTLLDSVLYLAQESDENRPILLVGENDEVILPVFTDLERLQRAYPDVKRYGTLPARNVFRVALQNEMYTVNINPEYGPGGFLERYELEALANGAIPVFSGTPPTLDDPKFVPFGSPELPSQEIIEQMIQAAEPLLVAEAGIDEGYLILTKSDNNMSRLTIALHFDDVSSADAHAEFTRRFVTAMETVIQQPLNLLWLEGERYREVKAHSTPFYIRD